MRAGDRPFLLSLPRTVVALGVVSLLTDLSSEMIYPLLPVFLATVLGAGPIALGAIEGVAESTASLLKIVSGFLTDRTGRRKPLVVAGYSLSGLARPAIGLATVWPAVLVCRFFDRVGKGVRTSPRDALIADSVPAARRGAAFGLHRAMDHAGAVLGPAVAALLLWAGFGYRSIFLLAVIPGALVVLVLVAFVRDAGPAAPRPAAADDAPAAPLPPRRLAPLLGAVMLNAFGTPSDTFLLLRLSESGVTPSAVALLWSLHSLVRVPATLAAGALADRMPRFRLVLTGWLARAVAFVALGATEHLPALVSVFLLYGLVVGVTEPAEKAFVADVARSAARGRAYGLYNGAVGLGALPASLLFGFVWSVSGPLGAFGCASILTVLAALAALALRPGQVGAGPGR